MVKRLVLNGQQSALNINKDKSHMGNSFRGLAPPYVGVQCRILGPKSFTTVIKRKGKLSIPGTLVLLYCWLMIKRPVDHVFSNLIIEASHAAATGLRQMQNVESAWTITRGKKLDPNCPFC